MNFQDEQRAIDLLEVAMNTLWAHGQRTLASEIEEFLDEIRDI